VEIKTVAFSFYAGQFNYDVAGSRINPFIGHFPASCCHPRLGQSSGSEKQKNEGSKTTGLYSVHITSLVL
jgi:hypothetical protein